MEVNAWNLGGRVTFFVLIFVVAVAGKIAGSGLGAYWTGFTSREALAVGVGMIPRGEVGLITASLGLAAGLVTRQVYTQAVALVLLTTLITPAILRYAFPKAAEPIGAEPIDDDGLTTLSVA
jgi:Kef-type K+ transport system membrane component KefB